MPDIFDSHIIRAVAAALLHSLWIGAVIVCLLILASNARILVSSKQRYYAYMTGLLSLLYFTGFAFFLEYASVDPTSEFNIQYLNSGTLTNFSGSASMVPALTWQGVVVLVWLIGMVAFATVHIMGLHRLWNTISQTSAAPVEWQNRLATLCRRSGVSGNVRIVSSSSATIPFVFGIMRPLIVFPATYFIQLTPREIESILMHELAHISRNDFLLNIIQVTVESILFFNPATWWLSREIRTQREYCCDDHVWTTHSKRTYLQALYKVACLSAEPHYQPVALFQNNSELMIRVKRMSQKSEPARSLRPLLLAALGMIAISGLCAFSLIEDRRIEFQELEFQELEAIALSPELEFANLELTPVMLTELLPMEIVSRDIIESRVDTHPPSKRMLELQAEIEKLSDEIESISEEMEEQIEEQVEVEVEKIEALAEQMEAIAEEQEEWVENELESSPEMKRLEELSETMENQWEELEEQFEEMNEAAVEAIEEKMEAKSEEYEHYNELSQEDKEKLDREMKELSAQMNAEMEELHKAHREMMENQEFKALQEEMEMLHRQIAQKHLELQPRTEEIQRLQEQMMVQQEAIQQKMQGQVQELQKELETRHVELQRLHKELDLEIKKWEEEHKKD